MQRTKQEMSQFTLTEHQSLDLRNTNEFQKVRVQLGMKAPKGGREFCLFHTNISTLHRGVFGMWRVGVETK